MSQDNADTHKQRLLTGQSDLALYTNPLSLCAGEIINFHVLGKYSTEPLKLDIQLRGQGAILYSSPSPVYPSKKPLSPNPYAVGCMADVSASLSIPMDWASGIYVATFKSPDGEIKTDVPFVVRSPRIAPSHSPPVLVVLPLATMNAYNKWGGASSYASEFPKDFPYIKSWTQITF